MNVQEKIERIEALEAECYERFKALKAEVLQEKEFPQYGDKYWYMTTTGKIFTSNWDGFDFNFDLEVQEIGNIYKTKKQAEFAVKKLKVEAELRKFSRPFKEDENNYYIELHLFDKTLLMGVSENFQKQGVIYFESEEKTQQAVSTIGEERIKKYIFGVED